MKDIINKELSYLLDDNTKGFFSVVISWSDDLKIYIPTIITICEEKATVEQQRKFSDKLHELGEIIREMYSEDTHSD